MTLALIPAQNWSPFWKFFCMVCSTGVTFSQGFGPLALAPMFPQLMESFQSDLAAVVQFTGVCILVLGFSNFIWVPIATSFGRRPVALASTLICFGSHIWRAKATTYESFMGACVLNGIGAGPAETLQPTVIADVMFLHERGRYNTLYFAVYFGSLMVAPIISGPMADKTGFEGWRNFWWLNVALHGAVFIACIFGFPETKWPRAHPRELQETGQIAPTVTNGKESNTTHNETTTTSAPDTEKITTFQSNGEETSLSKTATAQRDPYLGKGSPSKQQFKLFQPNPHPLRSILLDLWIPWKLFAFPIVEFAAFVVSWTASCFLAINLTQSQAFSAPPYNFSSETIGFMNFAILVGAVIGLFTAGPFSDWISAYLTKKNKGIREPEMRLISMIPYVLLTILGSFVIAYGFEYKWDWKIIVIIGWTAIGIQVAALPAISSTYAVDSYKPVAGSIFVAITVNKNVWGYGFSVFITPWSEKSGFVQPILTNMALTVFFCSFAILFWFVGKKCRVWTRNSSVHRM